MEVEGTDPGCLNGVWELHILKHLIKCCNKVLESEDGGTAGESVSEFEDGDNGPDDNKLMMHPNKGKRNKFKNHNQHPGEASLPGWTH